MKSYHHHMNKQLTLSAILISLYFFSCHSPIDNKPLTGKDSNAILVDPANLPAFKHNPEFRKQVKKDPVAEYLEKIENRLNNGPFAVRLYETSKTMYYQVKVEFDGLPGEDTIKLPDLGTPPHPVLQKGKDQYSCIIGLLDNDRRFRELKLVRVTNHQSQLKITTLKHYIVMDHYRLVSEQGR
jgi:hypothetical protein